MSFRNTLNVWAAISVMIFLFSISTLTNESQSPVPDNPSMETLSNQEMAQAVPAHSAEVDMRVSMGETKIFRMGTFNNKPVHLRLYGTATDTDSQNSGDVSLMSTNKIVVCGYHIYVAGVKVATLRHRASIDFYGNVLRTPLSFNWGDMHDTKIHAPFYYWDDLSGPSFNPQKGSRAEEDAFANSSGTLKFLGSDGIGFDVGVYGITMGFSETSYYCSP